jgi:hypothetical protein
MERREGDVRPKREGERLIRPAPDRAVYALLVYGRAEIRL